MGDQNTFRSPCDTHPGAMCFFSCLLQYASQKHVLVSFKLHAVPYWRSGNSDDTYEPCATNCTFNTPLTHPPCLLSITILVIVMFIPNITKIAMRKKLIQHPSIHPTGGALDRCYASQKHVTVLWDRGQPLPCCFAPLSVHISVHNAHLLILHHSLGSRKKWNS